MPEKIQVKIKKAEGAADIPLPRYATAGSSGMDVYAAVPHSVTLHPGEIRLVPCGFYLSMPAGYEAEIRPRSGLALKHGITLVNTPGTVDSDYRGEVCLILTNLGKAPYAINRGDRMAQMVFKEVTSAELEVCEELDDTVRASGGFGHSGVAYEKED